MSKSNTIRKKSQIASIVIFLLLIIQNKMQLWLLGFLFFTLLSVFLGRIFCGYVCPINSVFEFLPTNFKKRLSKKINISSNRRILLTFVKYLILVLFIASIILMSLNGIKLPVLPVLILIGLIVALIWGEAIWHKYLCPFGTVLGLSSYFVKFGYNIDTKSCITCGKCKRICPTDAISNDVNYKISKNLCLLCNKCFESCPNESIRFNCKPFTNVLK